MNKKFKYGDIIIALLIVALVMLMIIPLPPTFISFLIILNFSLSLLILFITLYIANPLEFSVFPSILLVLTLLDLTLNISITRKILLEGNAGDVVHAFGEVVVGGNVIVGLVVFAIITIVQFIVITKGSERIAEVAARFTLDAMPGKQMSIDADLSAGLITNEEARRRRKEIEDEADFYGAMDGASKFVKGNVIAAVIIIFINIIGGMIMGYLRGRMTLAEIARTYTILTIGEGLVAQIPALLVSIAMGIIVTRAASKSDLGSDFSEQISKQPKALKIVAGILYAFAFLSLFTKLPTSPFLIMAIFITIIINMLKITVSEATTEEVKNEKQKKKEETSSLYNILKIYTIEIDIGYGLLTLINERKKGNLLDRLKFIRENLSKELGFLIPNIRVKDNSRLKSNAYTIKIKGNEIAEGEILIGYYLAMGDNNIHSKIKGIPTTEPTFGLPAVWITEKEKIKAEDLGFTVVDSVTVMATHLTEVLKNYAHEIFGRKELNQIIDLIKTENPSLIEELIPNTLNIGDIEIIMQNLLKERIPIRDAETILDTLANYGKKIKETDILTEMVREALSRTICKQFQNGKNNLTVISFDPKIEKIITKNVKQINNEIVYSLDPSIIQKIILAIGKALEKLLNISNIPLAICSPGVRFHLKRLTEKAIPNLNIISYNEVDPLFNVESVDVITLPDDEIMDEDELKDENEI